MALAIFFILNFTIHNNMNMGHQVLLIICFAEYTTPILFKKRI